MNRPRVLQLITHLDPGGAQETVILLAKGLPARGFDVVVAGRPGSEAVRLTEAGITYIPVDELFRPISLGKDARAFRAIHGILRDQQVDVVHTHSSKAGVIGRISARLHRVPAIVHTSHGLPINPDMGRGQRIALLMAERASARVSHRVIAVSRATSRELLHLKLARSEQIEIIPSGVAIGRFASADRAEARRLLELPDDALVVGWVGRHFEQKRPQHVIEVARRVVERVPRAMFVLIGDGPLLERSRAAASGDRRIRVVGHRSDVDRLYAAFDLFLLASAWEGLPRTVLEAQAAGVPVVATDVNGVREAVRPGETGYLAPAGDIDQLAERVSRLLENGEERVRLSENAKRTIDAEYSEEHTIAATARLYEDLLTTTTRR
ncbi:MAG TPA: glycosyltransferase family 4 protein [Actinomycetota bacterium]|nr:glycosyltransferase family 4 protein [Actinomycetota bacterium]